MASHLISSVPRPKQGEWARLIPGQVPATHSNFKKPPQSVRMFPVETAVSADALPAEQRTAMALLLPSPLSSPRDKRWLRSVTIDCAIIALNWLLLAVIADHFRILFPGTGRLQLVSWSPVSLLGISILHTALITLVGYTEGLYASNSDLAIQTRILMKSILLSTPVLCIAYSLQGAPWNITASVCLAGPLHFALLWTWRWCDREQSRATDASARNVLIVGSGSVAERAASYIEGHPWCGRRVCGFLDDEKPLSDEVIGRTSELAAIARREFVDEVILAAPRDRNVTLNVLREARRLHLDVELIPELFGCDPEIGEIEQVGGFPIICVHAEQLPHGSLRLKRIIDVCGSVFGLTVLTPLLLIIAALIKLDSRGPVLYVAQRAGRKGRLFGCYKFRTMVSNADLLKDALRHKNERSGPIFKLFDDPRITRVGRYLRHYSLDELPQLWNVLKGEMSLVGPRPHPLDDFAAYELSHFGRLDVTPGITGLWQVSARRDPSFERAMDLDREYIRTWSLGLDLQILLRTIRAVAQGSGN